jgi:hypothetical protein
MGRKRQPPKRYAVTGVVPTNDGKVVFRNRRYHLANLSDEDLAFLKQFPEEFPYLTTGSKK